MGPWRLGKITLIQWSNSLCHNNSRIKSVSMWLNMHAANYMLPANFRQQGSEGFVFVVIAKNITSDTCGQLLPLHQLHISFLYGFQCQLVTNNVSICQEVVV